MKDVIDLVVHVYLYVQILTKATVKMNRTDVSCSKEHACLAYS